MELGLKQYIELLKENLVHPIEISWNGYYGNQKCKYCNASLGNKYAAATEHIKTCEKIPANITYLEDEPLG